MTLENGREIIINSSNKVITPIYNNSGIYGVNVDIKDGNGCTVDRVINMLETMKSAIDYLNDTNFDGVLLISISYHIFKLETGYKLLYKVLSEYKDTSKLILEIPREFKYSKEEKYLKRKKIKIAYYDENNNEA